MKNLIIIVMSALTLGCSHSKEDWTNISILDDRTEKDFYERPDVQSLNEMLEIDRNIWRGYSVRYGQINSMQFNPRRSIELLPQNEYLSNNIERWKQVTGFKSQMSALIEAPGEDTEEYSQSIIWKPLLEEIEYLCAQQRPSTLYLFSDGLENTHWYSAYAKRGRIRYKDEQDKNEKLFLSVVKAEALCDFVKVVIVYKPLDIDADREFAQMLEVYKNIFNKLNIPFTHQATFNQTHTL